MYALKVLLKDAEKAKKILEKIEMFDSTRKLTKEESFIYLPIKERINKKDISFGEVVEKELEKKEIKEGSIKKILKEKLTEKELGIIKRAFEVVGSIAIIEVPKEMEEREKIIADAVMQTNKNIKTVLKKASAHEGVFRIQRYEHVLGEKTTQTILHENNVRLKVDISKAYFSSKMSHERARIASQVKKGERVLCMFAGVGPYPCVIAKNSAAEIIFGIELNKDAYELSLENIKINKLKNVQLLIGDVKYVVPILKEKGFVFDRIVMPAPKCGEDFIELPFLVGKANGVVHLYTFCTEKEIPSLADRIKENCKAIEKDIEILQVVKCGQVGVRNYRVCVDFRIM